MHDGKKTVEYDKFVTHDDGMITINRKFGRTVISFPSFAINSTIMLLSGPLYLFALEGYISMPPWIFLSLLVISVTLLTISALMVLPNRDNHFKKFFSDNKAISTALSDCKKNGGHSVPIGSMKTIRLSPSMNRPMIEAVPDEDRTTYDVTETAEHEDGKYYIKVAYTVADDQNKATMGH